MCFSLNNPFWGEPYKQFPEQWVQIRFRMAWLAAAAACLPSDSTFLLADPCQAPGEMTLLGTEFLPVNEVILQEDR